MEPNDGLFAIAFVVKNRAETQHKPICKVVWQSRQFSWTNHALDGNNHLLKSYLPPNNNQWLQCKLIANMVISGEIHDFTHGATHYYADYIRKPVWAKHMQETGKWGSHHFLKQYLT